MPHLGADGKLNNLDYERQQNMENESLRRLYMQLTNECKEIQKTCCWSSCRTFGKWDDNMGYKCL